MVHSQSMTAVHHAAADRHHGGGGHRRRSKIIDVDEVSERRERRRTIKKRLSSIFNPFHLHLHQHHHDDHPNVGGASLVTTPTKNNNMMTRSLPFTEPTVQCDDSSMVAEKHFIQQQWVSSPSLQPLRLEDHLPHSTEVSSSSSSESISDIDSDEATMEYFTLHAAEPITTSSEEDDDEGAVSMTEYEEEDGGVVTGYGLELSMVLFLAMAHSFYKQLEEQEQQQTQQDVEEVPRLEESTRTTRMPRALLEEIVHHKHLDAVIVESCSAAAQEVEEETVPMRRCLPQALLDEIVHHQHLDAMIVQSCSADEEEKEETPVEDEEATAAVSAPQEEPQEAVATTTTAPSEDNDIVALKEKCDQLGELTLMLSKKLVESTLHKQRENITKRKESKLYYDMIRKVEEQHRLERMQMLGDMKHLEGELRRHKVESVPPVVIRHSVRKLTQEDEQKTVLAARRKNSRPRRRSLMDTLVTPIERCTATTTNSSSASSCRRASFSMASTMIMQNKLMPAMLSAVARGGSSSIATTQNLK